MSHHSLLVFLREREALLKHQLCCLLALFCQEALLEHKYFTAYFPYVVMMELCDDRGGVADLSLEQAIRHKYCPLVEDNTLDPLNHRTITQTALKYKPGIYIAI